MSDVLPVARTSAEAHLYMDLHPCGCGETAFARDSSVIEAGADLAGRYAGVCARCGRPREFVFALPPDPPRLGGPVDFGPGRSVLIGPGGWLFAADRWAGQARSPGRELDQQQLRTDRQLVAHAAAAIEQVLRFVPAGADEVPPEAFSAGAEHAVWAAEPGRFSVPRLRVVLATYQEILDEYDVLLG